MNLNFDFNGKTTLAKWWKIVKENFQKIVDAINVEVSARQTADSDLAARLSKVEQISGGTGGGNSLNNYEYDYDSENDTVINIYTVTALPSGIYTFIPEKEVTALYTVIADGTAPWYSLNNVFTPGNQYILQAGDSDNMDVIGVIPLEPDSGDFVNVKLSEIVTAEYTDGTYRFDVSIFAEQNKTLVIFNDLDNDVPELLVNDMYGYTITQALEAGKLYVTVTTKLHEDNGIDGQYSGAIDVYAWNGPESGGSSITVDSELSDTSENPVQNRVVNEALSKKMDYDEPYPGFKTMDDVCQAVLDLQNSDTNSDSLITVDSELSNTSENPVQNKVVNEALNKKMDWECNYGGFNNMDEALTAIFDLQNRVSALEGK